MELVAHVAREAGITVGPRVTASWLRAAHAVWAHKGGATPEDIQAALGLHSRRSVDRYLAAAPPIGRTTADAVQDAIAAAGVAMDPTHEGPQDSLTRFSQKHGRKLAVTFGPGRCGGEHGHRESGGADHVMIVSPTLPGIESPISLEPKTGTASKSRDHRNRAPTPSKRPREPVVP